MVNSDPFPAFPSRSYFYMEEREGGKRRGYLFVLFTLPFSNFFMVPFKKFPRQKATFGVACYSSDDLNHVLCTYYFAI